MINLSEKERSVFNLVLKNKNEEFLYYEKMITGVHSNVYLLNNKYIIKFNNQVTIKGEKIFFENNISRYNETILFYDNNNDEYIVYNYIDNDNIEKEKINIEKLKNNMKEYIFSYKECDWNGYGYLFEEKKSWNNFFESEMSWRKQYAFEVLNKSEYNKVEKAISVLNKYPVNKVILHGDLGIHNLLFKNNDLVGVIDPQPIAGDCIYDYIFFIFSDLIFCKDTTMLKLYNDLQNEATEKIDALVILVLFDRIIRCVRHKSNNINEYLKLWENYTNQINL